MNEISSGTKEKKGPFVILSLTLHCLGIIFGDIGTSPLYVLQTIFHRKKVPPNESECIGAVSLIIWSLIFVVSIKYSIFILQADHQGEGGTFALCALLTGKSTNLKKKGKHWVNIVSILAASLLIGDGALTPAVSVLSAVEGLTLNSSTLHKWILPITILILICLFLCQQWGTSKIGYTFGPIMLIWFSCLFSIGIWRIGLSPSILKSFNPLEAILYLIKEKGEGFYHIGGVFLSVTGCEALFADLGHFGVWPVRLSWFLIVFPSVITNYLGQGALIIVKPEYYSNPFYRSVPEWGHWPMIILSTIATIIASQAIITGCFSLISQGSSLGFCAPLRIYHTNEQILGQIYVPIINNVLLVLTLLMTIYFGSSSDLTNAYGLTVCSVSVITTILYLMVMYFVWNKSSFLILLFSLFLILDLLFWSANAMKFLDGAWIALLIAFVFFLIGYSWYYGEQRLKRSLRFQFKGKELNQLWNTFGLTKQRQLSLFLSNNQQEEIVDSSDEEEEEVYSILKEIRLSMKCDEIELNLLDNVKLLSVTPGVGIYLINNNQLIPSIFENYIRLIRSIPQRIIFIQIEYLRIPYVLKENRLLIKSFGYISVIKSRFGYNEKKKKCLFKDILLLAKELYQYPIPFDDDQISYFIPNEILILPSNQLKTFLSRLILSFYRIEKDSISNQLNHLLINSEKTIAIGIIIQL